jgi:tetratricopeptide (TPR) repeat protein
LASGLALAALFVSAAAPPPDWEALVRQGDASFARGDYAAAVALYEQAQDRTTDPGLVALDLAAARYRLALASDAERPRLAQEAEQAYRCCTGPGDPRRAPALYGVGAALLLKSDGRDADALQAAVEAYRQCLAEPGLGPELAEDARHNLERARLLLLQVVPRAAHTRDELPSGDGPPKAQPPDRQPGAQQDPRDRPGVRVKPDRHGDPAKSQEGPKPVEPPEPPPPGEGNLPPVPEGPDLPPLSAEDAARHLELAARRIHEEQKTHRRSKATAPPPNVPDW